MSRLKGAAGRLEDWKKEIKRLEAAPEGERDPLWKLAYGDALLAVSHVECREPRCSCHFPPGYDQTTGELRAWRPAIQEEK